MSSNQNRPDEHVQNRPSGSRPRGPMGGGPMGPMAMGAVQKAKNFKGSFKKLVSYLSPYKWKIIVVILFAALSTVFTIIGPRVLAKATDELVRGLISVITGGSSGIDFGYIEKILLILLGLYVISAGFSYFQGFTMARISNEVSYNMRNRIMKKINRLPLGYFNKTSHGEVLSRITNDVDTLTQSLNQSITQLITSATALVGIIIMMFTISWRLTLVTLLIVPATFVLVTLVVKKSQKYFKDQQKYLGTVNGHVEEMYGGHLIMKAFNGEAKSLERFEGENEKLYQSAWKSQFLSGLMFPLMNFISNIGYVAICILGASLAAGGTMTLGGIQAFMQYMRSFTQPIIQLANISNQFQMMVASSERVFEFLDEQEETVTDPIMHVNHTDKPDTDHCVGIRGDVRFEHVKFGYEPGQFVIKDFSADIRAGQKVAIVGPTGAGKTTMVKLLMRFHELSGGAIFVDGHNVCDFSRADLRSEFGMVLQDTWLFNGTIRDNIRYGKLGATDEDILEAAKAAQVDHFIRTLPDGYNMVLNEEATNVSQGQKQLLTIARAILADARILILDEATSSVDTRTEILIQKAMDHLMKGRTSFIIAHRLSTIRNADLILCMNEGDIVEQGTHEELMRMDGFYAKLYNSQFEKVS